MKSKISFLALLLFALLATSVSCVKDSNLENNATNGYHIHISKISSSTTNISLAWEDDKGDNINYTIKVYNDATCSDLYQSYSISFGANDKKRFTIPYLECGKTYYVRIENITGSKSQPFAVSLTAPVTRRVILSQNFDNLFWGYDYVNLAHGVIIKDGGPNYFIEDMSEAIADSEVTTKIDDHGGLLFKYRSSMLELMGFKGWDKEKNKNVRILPGYIKLGAATDTGVLCTPAFSELEGTQKVIITFNACVFAKSLNAKGGKVTAKVCKGNGEVLHSQDFNMTNVSGKPTWESFKLEASNVTKECYCVIETTSTAKEICLDELQIVQHIDIPEKHIYGYVSDETTGEPIKDVVISDGFKVTTTDKYGFYLLPRNGDAAYVFYSIPAEYEVIAKQRGPLFYSEIKGDNNEYNFSLRKLPGGKEQKFALFTFADPQVSSNDKLNRFKNEAVPAVKAHSSSLGIPCYGITLGDIVSNGNSSNTTQYMTQVRDYTRKSVIGMSVFQVMGNHDCNYFNETDPLPLEPDCDLSTYPSNNKEQIKAQGKFEETFGPVNYSFNRGDIHIVAMRDILYASNTTQSGYHTGFTKEQYEWLEQDLSYVPRDNMVVLCVHIPLYNVVSNSGEEGHYIQEVHDLLNEFNEAHILSGHMHTQTNHIHSDYNIYEHNMASVCGAWWLSNITGDGVPNGYGVFIGEGNTFTDWYYMGYAEGMNTRSHQMRLYKGDAKTGAEKPAGSKRKYAGYYQFNFGSDVILANVYNADENWTIRVYEEEANTGNMMHTGNMELIPAKKVDFKKLEGDYTFESPRKIKDGTVAPYELWVTGVHLSLDDNTSSSRGWTQCSHLYKYKLKNPKAKTIKVEAVDQFGNIYEETKFTDYNDHAIALKPGK